MAQAFSSSSLDKLDLFYYLSSNCWVIAWCLADRLWPWCYAPLLRIHLQQEFPIFARTFYTFPHILDHPCRHCNKDISICSLGISHPLCNRQISFGNRSSCHPHPRMVFCSMHGTLCNLFGLSMFCNKRTWNWLKNATLKFILVEFSPPTLIKILSFVISREKSPPLLDFRFLLSCRMRTFLK